MAQCWQVLAKLRAEVAREEKFDSNQRVCLQVGLMNRGDSVHRPRGSAQQSQVTRTQNHHLSTSHTQDMDAAVVTVVVVLAAVVLVVVELEGSRGVKLGTALDGTAL